MIAHKAETTVFAAQGRVQQSADRPYDCNCPTYPGPGSGGLPRHVSISLTGITILLFAAIDTSDSVQKITLLENPDNPVSQYLRICMMRLTC